MGTARRAARLLGFGGRGEDDDRELVRALREGDEEAFMSLVERYHASLVRMARMYVPSNEVAEEVVQETWIAVLKGIGRFERRSSLKTWIYSILVNIAKTRGQRERRSIPFSASAPLGSDEPAVDPDRFLSSGDWALGPTDWETPEESLLSGETRELILHTIDGLSESQKEVITLRDIEGWSSDEVCNALEITETNQRVLLHRARSKVRAALEHYLGAMEPTAS
jgi:RNA polymerase sigma-70 factor (ECF subfamily)